MTISLTPGLICILGGLLGIFMRGTAKKLLVLTVPVLAFIQLIQLTPNDHYLIKFLFSYVDLLYVDNMSIVFGTVFLISAFFAFIYGLTVAKRFEYSSALIYVGSALSVVFAKDLISLYVFWELMAISSVMLIFLRNTEASRKSALRYIIIHIVGGLVLLAGIMLHVYHTSSVEFVHFSFQNLATWLMLIGVLVNAAAVPFSTWLSDSYPESTIMGGVILSAYTSKTAIYVLLRGFAGWDVLIWIGIATSLYGIIYGILQNDIRRILAFSIINQVGFMICAVGIGTPLAIAGACAHAFCHIVYKGLLWMTAGAVIESTGKSKCTELGGLYYAMPVTFICAVVGVLSISAFPFTSGFISKTLILKAAELSHLFWPWMLLEISAAAGFLLKGVYLYFVFFSTDRKLQVKPVRRSMVVGMVSLSVLCIYLGCVPQTLYNLLPYSKVVFNKVPYMFSDLYGQHFGYALLGMQKFFMSVLAFCICLPILKRVSGVSLDLDWVYRRGLRYVVLFFIQTVDIVYNAINQLTMWIVRSLSGFLRASIPTLIYLINIPYLRMSRVPVQRVALLQEYTNAVSKQGFTFSVLGCLVFIVFILLYVFIAVI
jgi:multicomponent Na+:H+ antiporter subunit D